MALHCPHLLDSNLGCLAAVVGVGLLPEPRVLQCLLRGDPAGWIVDKDLGKEVQEKLQELVVRGDYILAQY